MKQRVKVLIVSILGAVVVTSAFTSISIAQLRPQGEKIKLALPSVPRRSELHPTVFDENGCLRISELDGGGIKCGPKSVHPNGVTEARTTSVNLKGFAGLYHLAEVDGQAVRVIESSITQAGEGTWSALGLVRNETLRPVGGVEVMARLIDGSNNILDEVLASVTLPHIRPGEPAPFKVEANVNASQVARVEWLVTPKNPKGPLIRDFRIYVSMELLYGMPTYRGHQRNDAPFPYVLSVGTHHTGNQSARNPELIVAWLDEQDRVVWLESAAARLGATSAVPTDGTLDFHDIVVTDEQIASRLGGLKKMFWVVAK